ncbi:MAG: sodium:solute symporter [Bryobacteraceae bacterium]
MLNHWSIVPVFVVGFLFINLILGLRAAKGVHTVSDHVVGGRGLGFLLVFFTSIGEIYSSVAFLGQPGWAYEHGVTIIANVGVFIGLTGFWLGPKIWEAGHARGYMTQAQFLGDRYQSELLRGLVAVMGVIALVAYISIQMMGGGYVFEVTTEGHIPFWLGSLLAFGTVAIYVATGGLRAIGWVAVLKGFFMAAVGIYIVVRVVGEFYGGLPAMFAEIAARSPAHLTLPGPKGFATYAWTASSLLNGVLAFYMWPHMFSNFYSAQNPRIIRRQAVLIPLYNIITLSFTMVGFAGILVLHNIRPDTVMVEMLKKIAPMWLIGLFCAGALSASMVTGAACSLAAAATIGNDLLQPRFRWSEHGLKTRIQWLVLVVIAIAYSIALMRPGMMVYIILIAYGVTGQMLPGVLASFYRPSVRSHSVITGIVAGFVVIVVMVAKIVEAPGNTHPGIIALAVNFLVVWLMEVFRKDTALVTPVSSN